MNYQHTQTAPLGILLAATGAAFLAGGWVLRTEPVALFAMLVAGVSTILASLMFGSLTVADEGEKLAVTFGPLPVFRKHIEYEDVTAVEPDRSSLIDGWGIHYVPGRGWTYNLWGFDCVKLLVCGKVVRIGSDDVPNLVVFLRSRLGQAV